MKGLTNESFEYHFDFILYFAGEPLTSTVLSPVPTHDPHVCETCQTELPNLETYIAHKVTCLQNKEDDFFNANESDTEMDNHTSPVTLQKVSELSPSSEHSETIATDAQEVSPEDLSQGQGRERVSSPSEQNHTEKDSSETRPDSVPLEEDENDNDEDDMIDEEDHINEEELEEDLAYMKMMGQNLFSQNNEDDEEDDLEDDEEDEDGEKGRDMMPFSPFLNGSASNVVIEPISGTKAAVAQFAENNVAPADMAVLQTTLYSLQQQQIVQLQLIQQLQQQILLSNMTGTPPNINLSQLGSLAGLGNLGNLGNITSMSDLNNLRNQLNLNLPIMPPPALETESASDPLKELSSCIKSAGLSMDESTLSTKTASLVKTSETPESESSTSKSTTQSSSSLSSSTNSSSSSTASSTSSKPIPPSQPLPSNGSTSASSTKPPPVSEPSDFARLSMCKYPLLFCFLFGPSWKQ